MEKSKAGRVTSIRSAPFYTDDYGYKLSLRLYMNGEGMGKGTHLSIFVVIMRHDYDQLLEWPINKMITIRLLDQSPHIAGRQNLQATFLTNLKSCAFQRPVTEMNIAAGIPLFIPLSALRFKKSSDDVDDVDVIHADDDQPWYVVDDQMFFEVVIQDPPTLHSLRICHDERLR
ncbi:hypothetical protein E1189_18465 [Sansalvadorimonas verongulae]|nr:hypothetical protein [Sansalvadorimonas verongulae]MTI14986.1 hypothetical protein [Sansalvadorimonas verongulae]